MLQHITHGPQQFLLLEIGWEEAQDPYSARLQAEVAIANPTYHDLGERLLGLPQGNLTIFYGNGSPPYNGVNRRLDASALRLQPGKLEVLLP